MRRLLRDNIILHFWMVVLSVLLTYNVRAQDTFSICAIDSITGQVGSAGATCITSSATSAIIISDVHPGVGVIHTQASWLASNQNYAGSLMNLGLRPQQIIDSVTVHDALNNPGVRQYGIVSLDSGGLSAAFTGPGCTDYKNHITGPGYSIQGNILLGQQVLDSMEAGFNNTTGSLACKLMAALQGAKVIGADTRCNPYGISSFSAFIRVANTSDTIGNLFLDITVNTYPIHIDPIDTLQVLFNQWGGCGVSTIESPGSKNNIKIFPNPVNDFLKIESLQEINSVEIFDMQGRVLVREKPVLPVDTKLEFSEISRGIYFLLIKTIDGNVYSKKIIKE